MLTLHDKYFNTHASHSFLPFWLVGCRRSTNRKSPLPSRHRRARSHYVLRDTMSQPSVFSTSYDLIYFYLKHHVGAAPTSRAWKALILTVIRMVLINDFDNSSARSNLFYPNLFVHLEMFYPVLPGDVPIT